MFELLCEQAAAAPERAVAITFDRSISYAALAARARVVARRLRRSGVQRGDRVGLLCDNRVEWLEVLFAAAAIGAILIPFSTWSTARELDFLLSDSEVRLLFAIPALWRARLRRGPCRPALQGRPSGVGEGYPYRRRPA